MAECEVGDIGVFNKLFLVTIEGTGKLDCILNRSQIMIKLVLLTF